MDRDRIIANMCYTYRHDYGIVKEEGEGFAHSLSSGMTPDERQHLWNTMAQIFDNDIAPHMEFKTRATARNICGND
jgi:hypothetical protein